MPHMNATPRFWIPMAAPRPRRTTVIATLLVLPLCGVPDTWAAPGGEQDNQQAKNAQTDAADAPPLAEQRWNEDAYGISLRPPANAEHIEQTNDGALVHFTVPKQYDAAVFVYKDVQMVNMPLNLEMRDKRDKANKRRTIETGDMRFGKSEESDGAQQTEAPTPMNLQRLKDGAVRQVAFANPRATLLTDEMTRIAGRTGARVYYRMHTGESRRWLFAQVFMRIDPYTVALFQLNTEPGHEAAGRSMFEAMLDSIEVTPPEALDERRKQWIEAGQRWIDDIEPAQLEESLAGERWQRILRDGKDVGYVQTRAQQTQTLGREGIRIIRRQRLHSEGAIYDTYSERFESRDGTFEMWSVRTAQRTDQPDVGLPSKRQVRAQQSWAETGLRDGRMLTITRDTPNEAKKVDEWNRLPEAYLSQVRLKLLPSLLPHESTQTLAFYAYYTRTKKVGLRTWRVVPLDSGGYRVYEKPAPDRAPQIATYDAHGGLVQRRMADGRVFLPSSAEQIQQIWRNR